MPIIGAEVQQLLVAEHLFWETQKLIRQNAHVQKPSAFYRYMGDAHIALVVSGIRRQVKVDARSISIARLLSEIAEQPEKVSRKGYCDLYCDSVASQFASRHFDKIAGLGRPHYPKARAVSDLRALRERVRACEAFADRRIAHRDTREPSVVPKFVDVTRSIRHLDRLWCKYNLLLTAANYRTLMPTFQDDWSEIFECAWKQPRRAV